jgi:RNA polymerase sigma-70 factor (ECF subfamily)
VSDTGNIQKSVNERQLDDETLMARIAQGNEVALSELYDRYSRLVNSIAYHLLGRRDLAEDVTLDSFVRIWEKAHTYNPERGRVSTWLTRVARHRAIDVLRREAARPERESVGWQELSSDPPVEARGPEALAHLNIEQQRVRRAVAALPEEQRDALALAYFQGLTHREIAETLEAPLGTIKGRIRAAMTKLRYELSQE